MNLKKALGFPPSTGEAADEERRHIVHDIHLKLAALGFAPPAANGEGRLPDGARDLVESYREQKRLLSSYLCPVDRRIQDFVDGHFRGVALNGPIELPHETFVLDRHGIARVLSLPAGSNRFESDVVSSYRVQQGILHNPRNDRRTTKGVFHVAEGGLPVPADKVAVPKAVFGNMLHAALHPPLELLRLPYTAGTGREAEIMISILLRPIVCPEIPGVAPEKTTEVRFFVPGNLAGNLDFIESIFGNAGNPYLPENDAALDVERWTGHTGCVILAPHLRGLRKREVGLPAWDDAAEAQRAQGMCWKDPEEVYNNGEAFKLTCRTGAGVMVTLIADNYFGYAKKEVKTQISYAANLFGLCEEEHAGGALAFPRYNYGDEVNPSQQERLLHLEGHSIEEVQRLYSSFIDFQPEGHGVDKNHPGVVYVPEDARVNLNDQCIAWTKDARERRIKLLPDHVYIYPSGSKVQMEKHPAAPQWRLVVTDPEGTFCHKPCTVSGGGKSEISKSISDAVIYGPVFVADLEKDFEEVDEIFRRDYSDRFLPAFRPAYGPERRSRNVLSPLRSLGSVIKLLTPSTVEYTAEYNAWLRGIPSHILALVFSIKRFHKPEWGEGWRDHFSVDIVNSSPSHSLKYRDRKLVGSYLRVGHSPAGAWRTFKLREDFLPAEKIQMEDDISASVTVPAEWLSRAPADLSLPALKLVANCEFRFFQRPDDAVHRGYDKQAEADIASPGTFLSNFQPLTPAAARELIDDIIHFGEYTRPMKKLIRGAAKQAEGSYFVSSAHPRLVGGKPSQNPRYLQARPDLVHPSRRYLAEVSTRLHRRLPAGEPVIFPVHAVLAGRRNNPPDPAAGIRPLAVYNPIHYQQLPELFMDFICSLTGKSPSTTGAGSEGALTKGPFNAVCGTADLNNALLSFILTGHHGFTTAAGHVGPNVCVDHDISLLVPEIWCRLKPHERDPAFMIREKFLERVEDFTFKGRKVLASRLGYRITVHFVRRYFGRVFDNPAVVFDEALLKPETQDMEAFVDGVENIVEAQRKVALQYFQDGSIDDACPPLRALLSIMAHGAWEGRDATHPEVRSLFTREYVLASDGYDRRLKEKQSRDIALWRRHVSYLEAFLEKRSHAEPSRRLNLTDRLVLAKRTLAQVSSPAYLNRLRGTLGADPIHQPAGAGAAVPVREAAEEPAYA